MPRDHIEFVQSQKITWRKLPSDAARPGVECRVLSRDQESGAASVILRYPCDFKIEEEHYLNNVEEFFVLDGELRIGGTPYERHSYAYLPTGFPRNGMVAPEGAVVLTFFEGIHKNIFAPSPGYDESCLKIINSVTEKDFLDSVDPKVIGDGIKKLVLRQDRDNGERTWLLSMGPNNPEVTKEAPLETHPNVEEMYLVSGEISMPSGVMKKGAYFWRPGGIQHGPVGTLAGGLMFFRCKGGEFKTYWTEERYPIIWDAPYQPILPRQLAADLDLSSSKD